MAIIIIVIIIFFEESIHQQELESRHSLKHSVSESHWEPTSTWHTDHPSSNFTLAMIIDQIFMYCHTGVVDYTEEAMERGWATMSGHCIIHNHRQENITDLRQWRDPYWGPSRYGIEPYREICGVPAQSSGICNFTKRVRAVDGFGGGEYGDTNMKFSLELDGELHEPGPNDHHSGLFVYRSVYRSHLDVEIMNDEVIITQLASGGARLTVDVDVLDGDGNSCNSIDDHFSRSIHTLGYGSWNPRENLTISRAELMGVEFGDCTTISGWSLNIANAKVANIMEEHHADEMLDLEGSVHSLNLTIQAVSEQAESDSGDSLLAIQAGTALLLLATESKRGRR